MTGGKATTAEKTTTALENNDGKTCSDADGITTTAKLGLQDNDGQRKGSEGPTAKQRRVSNDGKTSHAAATLAAKQQ